MVRISLFNETSHAAETHLVIFNLAGQMIKEFKPFSLPAQNGTATLLWDGNDGLGRPMASGIYVVVCSMGPVQYSQRVTVCK